MTKGQHKKDEKKFDGNLVEKVWLATTIAQVWSELAAVFRLCSEGRPAGGQPPPTQPPNSKFLTTLHFRENPILWTLLEISHTTPTSNLIYGQQPPPTKPSNSKFLVTTS